jgi:hypothetical protein
VMALGIVNLVLAAAAYVLAGWSTIR